MKLHDSGPYGVVPAVMIVLAVLAVLYFAMCAG